MTRRFALALALAATLVAGGCAEVPTDPDEKAEFDAINDPLEPMNRRVFEVNMFLDRNVMKPVARAYVDYVPDGVRDSAHNAMNNLREPWTFVNDLLQARIDNAGDALGRFMLNSTFGVGGLFDVVASDSGVKFHSNDFGTTLAVWGMPEGPYLMLPFYGPSNPRDVTGRAAGWVAEPVDYAISQYSTLAVDGHTAMAMLDDRAQLLEPMDDLERNSIDLYAAVRSLYRQQRAAQAGQKPQGF